MSEPLRLYALTGIPLIEPGDDIAAPILAAAERVAGDVQEGDLLVVAQKIVSKSENRYADLRDVVPSVEAERLAQG